MATGSVDKSMIEVLNPNLFITFDPCGGIFTSCIYPFQESNPFTLNAAN